MALPNFANYVLPFWFSRWVSLAAGVYLMILSGSFYLFSVYSSTINVIFGYTTAQTNLVGTLGNVGLSFPSHRSLPFPFAYPHASMPAGGLFSVLGGLWLDRFGPRSTVIIGGIMSFVGTRSSLHEVTIGRE